MHLLCVGVSHHTAPLAFREKLTMGEEALGVFLNEQRSTGRADEIVALSTCNRVEVYFASFSGGFGQMIEYLAASRGVTSQDLQDHSYGLQGNETVNHLFRVAAGLDSLVIGEAQILGQVSQAHQLAHTRQTVGPHLSKLFQAAIFSAKRVQSETELSRLSASVPSLAVKLSRRKGKHLGQAHVLLVGAGGMAELAVEAFRKQGVKQFSVISRTLESADNLARRWGGLAGTLEQLVEFLKKADVLLCSSSATDALIEKKMIEEALAARADRSLIILDIAVPRNVHPDVRQMQNVFLYDIDDLQDVLEISQSKRLNELLKAEKIVQEEARTFIDYLASLDVVPVIRDLRQKAESIRKHELQKTLRRLPGLNQEQQEQISALTHSIVSKMLHHPTARLRRGAAGENSDHYVDLARQLYGLDQE